ncbi:ribonuclease Z [Flavobacterium cyanobacteriorum]|uniref:Ribonuclease Z n=1 Tax=Flavobacterium cyanobacteriorum TaxID=2022802 RepID=A0A255ZBN3_9FLAO|nr:ribonuclease Z [Flavobacterium cyanobacteriorum]OYQ38285.1 ribonuclease Z [Flavobacterium cyanobacteriorum]
MNLTILGCYAATPRSLTNPTSQVLEIRNRMFLIDCGEGTQVQLRKNKIRFSKINHVFISHLHGDHFYGLIGLVSTYALLNRQADLHIHAPKGAKEIILLQLRLSNSWTGYNLYFHEIEGDLPQVVFEDEKVIVTTIPLQHRIYTNGFLFREKEGSRKLNIEAVQKYNIDTCYYQKIKNGSDITLDDGRVIPNSELTFDPLPPKSYAFCSDTMYKEDIVPLIKDVDVLYHESTFLDSEEHYCERTMHCTAKQAAKIARLANAGHLILGHYSTRYDDIEKFREEASGVFKNVHLADDGKVFDFN